MHTWAQGHFVEDITHDLTPQLCDGRQYSNHSHCSCCWRQASGMRCRSPHFIWRFIMPSFSGSSRPFCMGCFTLKMKALWCFETSRTTCPVHNITLQNAGAFSTTAVTSSNLTVYYILSVACSLAPFIDLLGYTITVFICILWQLLPSCLL